MCYSLWYNAPTMLPGGSLEAEWYMSYRFADSLRAGAYAPARKLSANLYDELRIQVTGRQHRGRIIPQAVTHSLVLLKMGEIIARNMSN